MTGQREDAATAALHPPGVELAWKNRRLFAEREAWPEGAVEACEDIEREHPDWYPNYSHGGTLGRQHRDAGYYAGRRGAPWEEPPAYGANPQELTAAILAHRPASRW